MKLHLSIAFQVPPHLTGSIPAHPHVEGAQTQIEKAIEAAIDTAIEDGLFAAGGCLTFTIQLVRNSGS